MQNSLHTVREAKGLTRTALAIQAGVAIAKIGQVEKGLRVNQATAQKIAAALNEKPETVFPDFNSLRAW